MSSIDPVMSSGSTRRLVIVGGGEHATVLLDAVHRSGAFEILGFVDANPEARLSKMGVEYLGRDVDTGHLPDAVHVLGTGPQPGSRVRTQIVGRLGDVRWVAIVHPAARVAETVEVAPGAVVMAGAIVQPGAVLGAHCVVNSGAVVDHDVQVGAFASVGPGAAIGGGTVVGDRSHIGLGAAIRDHVSVGADAVVAMGAVVIGDVAPGATVMGVPAK